MKLSRKTLVTALTFLLIGIIGTSVVWVYAQPSTPFTISGGVYPSATSFTLSREGSTYFAKNAWGQIVVEDSNATLVINYVLGSNRIIYLKQATYVLTQNFPSIELKDLNNIQLIAEEGTIWLKDEPSGYVGQLLEIDGCTNVIVRGIIFDQDKDNPDHLMNPSFGLQWIVRVVGSSNHTYFYNCQFINGAQNGLVTGISRDILLKDSIIDSVNEHPIYLADSQDTIIDNCELSNYGRDLRGYLKIDHSKDVTVRDSTLNMNEDGSGNNASSYMFVIGSYANAVLLENNQYVNPNRASIIEGDYCTIRGGTFERISGTHNFDVIALYNTANFSTIENVNFINWVFRIINDYGGSDTFIQNSYFSGGVTSFAFDFGIRTSAIGNRFNPDITHGTNGFYSASGSGIIDQNHIPNSTLTFLFPSGAVNGTNFFY